MIKKKRSDGVSICYIFDVSRLMNNESHETMNKMPNQKRSKLFRKPIAFIVMLRLLDSVLLYNRVIICGCLDHYRNIYIQSWYPSKREKYNKLRHRIFFLTNHPQPQRQCPKCEWTIEKQVLIMLVCLDSMNWNLRHGYRANERTNESFEMGVHRHSHTLTQ